MTETCPDPVFEAPWHAQLFAVTVHLHDQGVFGWPEWAQSFGETLARHGLSRELDGGDDYFNAWLESLEGMLAAKDVTSMAQLALLKLAWAEAYQNTPHGQPVTLDRVPGVSRA